MAWRFPHILRCRRVYRPRICPCWWCRTGGPWARDDWGYSSFAQFFANRGYAVLTPNFRGSTGFGKKFLNAGNGAWGREMQDDLTWGVKHLVDDRDRGCHSASAFSADRTAATRPGGGGVHSRCLRRGG